MKNLIFAAKPLALDLISTLVFVALTALTHNVLLATALAMAAGGDVGQVELDHVVVPDGVRPSHLPRSGDPRPDGVAPPSHRVEGLRCDGEGAGADQAHVATQHVDELRQLVDREPSDDPANRRDPRVVTQLEQEPAADVGV